MSAAASPAAARLMLITDAARLPRAGMLDCLARWLFAAQPGSIVVQLREPALGARELVEFGSALKERARAAEQSFIVNDRLDVAVVLGADGAHLRGDSVSVVAARRFLGERAWVSVAHHEPAIEPDLGADAVVFSPVLEARKGRAAHGTLVLSRFTEKLAALPSRPAVFALGGVGPGSAAECIRAGAQGVAMLGAVFDPRAPAVVLGELGLCR